MKTQQETSPNYKLNPGFFFLSLGLIITLITSVVSFLNLVFATLDKKFPDVLNASYEYGYNTYSFESMRMALATLIIFFPVFLLLSYFWKKFTLSEVMGKIDEIIKKWLLYIILFITSLVIIIDLVVLVRYFVSGEIIRFIIKVLVTLFTALLVGKYYIILLLKKKYKYYSDKVSAVASAVFVIVAIVCSFNVMGSPGKQRLLRLDDKRIGDLQNIQYQLINYWQQKEKLPEKLSDMSNSLTGYSIPVDPEFEKGKKYEYLSKDKLSFELCAEFSATMPKGWQEYGGRGAMPMYDKVATSPVAYPYPGGGMNESWDHEEGRTCFTRTIDKDIYPPYPKPELR